MTPLRKKVFTERNFLDMLFTNDLSLSFEVTYYLAGVFQERSFTVPSRLGKSDQSSFRKLVMCPARYT